MASLFETANTDVLLAIASLLDRRTLAKLVRANSKVNRLFHQVLWKEVSIYLPCTRQGTRGGYPYSRPDTPEEYREENEDPNHPDLSMDDALDRNTGDPGVYTLKLLATSSKHFEHVCRLHLVVGGPQWSHRLVGPFPRHLLLLHEALSKMQSLQTLYITGGVFFHGRMMTGLADQLRAFTMPFKLRKLYFQETSTNPNFTLEPTIPLGNLTEIEWRNVEMNITAPRAELDGAYTSRIDISLVEPFREALRASRMTLQKIKLSPLTIDFDVLWSMTFPSLRALYLRNVDVAEPEGRPLMTSLTEISDEAWAGMTSRTQRRKEMIGEFFIRHTTLEDVDFTFKQGLHIPDWISYRLDQDCLPNLRKFSGSYAVFMWLIENGVTLSPLGTSLRTLKLYDFNPPLEQEWPGMSAARDQFFRSLTNLALKKKVNQQSSAQGSLAVCKPLLSGLETLDLVTLEPYQPPSDPSQDLMHELSVWSVCCGDTLRILKIPLFLGPTRILDPHLLPKHCAGFETLEYIDQTLIPDRRSLDLDDYLVLLARHLQKLKAISFTDGSRCRIVKIIRRHHPHGGNERVSFELCQGTRLYREW